ncbi:MAG TPA: cation diffusion facilitator family transporter [Capsulimonadaceae bacterium]|jgi:cation diffusion facilitator family transporter
MALSKTDIMKRQAAQWSVLSSSVFIALKIGVFMSTGSISVLAETFHSGADLVGSTVAMWSVRFADNPPDSDHAYGHGKFENMSGMLIALMILVAGAATVHEAIQHLSHPHELTSPAAALVVMGLSAIVNFVVSRNLLRVGKLTDSPALTADGHHLRTDIITSAGVFVSLLIMTIVPHAAWIDPVAAIIVSVFIFWIGLQIARDSMSMLTDAALPAHEERLLRSVLENDERVLGYHKLRTRKAGSHRHIDVHVMIADTFSFIEAHQVTEEIEEALREALGNVHPIIHIEPFEEELNHQARAHGNDVPKGEYRRGG